MFLGKGNFVQLSTHFVVESLVRLLLGVVVFPEDSLERLGIFQLKFLLALQFSHQPVHFLLGFFFLQESRVVQFEGLVV